MEHARLSAAGSSMWMNCSGSIVAQEVFREQHPDFDDSSEFAAEGTAVHILGETCLINGSDAKNYLGTSIDVEGELFEVTQEMVDAVQEYLDTVRAVKGKLYVEVKLDVSPWIEDGFGTADAVVITDDGVVHIFDLKYGKGVKVNAEKNSQAMIYALGVFFKFDLIYDIKEYVLTIVQPRMDHIDTYIVSNADLDEFGKDVSFAAQQALEEDAPRVPSETACRWCIAKPTCIELREHSIKHAMEGFEIVKQEGEPDEVDLKSLSGVLEQLPLVNKWVKAVTGYAEERLKTGKEVPGYKLVAGRGSRRWYDAKIVEKKLRNVKKIHVSDIFITKLISPAQAEKLLGKTHNIILEQIEKVPGKPTLAPLRDKRPAVNVEEGFENTKNEDS